MNNLPTKSMFTDLVWPIISIRKEIITKKTGEMLMSMDLFGLGSLKSFLSKNLISARVAY